MSQLITINLSKGPGTAWGFRLQGGKDFAQPLCIQKVNVGSVAEAAGLRAGDAIVSIGSSDALALRHKEAQDAIVKAGSSFQMVVQRGAMTWRPQVTALAQPKKTPEGPVATQTSLAATGKQQAKRAPKGFNAVPAGFGEVNGQPIVNPQYNSPINLYNEDSIMEALSAQSEVLGKGCLGINFRKFDREVKLRTDSPTYLMIHGEDAGGAPKPRKTLPPQDAAPQQPKPVFPAPQPGQQGGGSGVSSPVPSAGPTRSVQAPVTRPRQEGDASPGGATICSQCERPIIGVFVRIKDRNLHADCFKCNTCGTSLKNVGYYNINDKLYCDVHAKQAAKHHPPGPNMVPVTVQPGAPIPAGAVHAPVVKTNAPLSAAPPAAPAPPAEAAPVTPPATHPEDEYDAESLLSPLEEGTAVLHEAVTAHEAAPPPACPQPELNGPVDEAGLIETEPPAWQEEQQSETLAQDHVTAENEQQFLEAEAVREEAAAEAPEAEGEVSEAVAQQASEAEPTEHETQAPEPEQVPHPESICQPEPEPEVEVEYSEPQQAEPEPELVPEPQPEILQAPVLEPVVEEPPSPVRVTASEPAPSFAPAPAPIPIHPPAPAHGGSSANPAAFGAPSGGIDVRSHIPKKAARFVWPPRRAVSEECVGSHSPSWAPIGEVLKVPMPVHGAGPLPKTIPLLPTPPPYKDYESMVLQSVNTQQYQHQQQQQQQQQYVQTVQKSSSMSEQKTVVKTTFETQQSSSSVSVVSASASSSHMEASAIDGGGAFKSIMKGKISPPKAVPVTAPMPTVNFGPAVPLPAPHDHARPLAPVVAPPKPQAVSPTAGIKKSASVPGVKSVKAPVQALKKTDSFGFKPVKPHFGAPSPQGVSNAAPAPPARAPATPPTPIDPSTLPFAIPPAPFGPIPVLSPAPAAPKASSKPATAAPTVHPKPATSQPPKPTGPAPALAPVIDSAPAYAAPKVAAAPAAPAPIFTPAKPVAALAPAPMFNVGGGGGMPRPAPPPGMGGMSKPPGIPTKGIPGERTAPKRGRGVMTPAHASRIPVCANCQRQIRGPFVTALGKNWCPDHFHCTTESCRKPLIEIGFVEEKGSLYCENCYEQYLAPTCGKCDKRIKGDCLNAVGKQFHPECFCCAYCGKVFGSGAFYLEDGLPYCETDWNDLFTTKCVGCGFPIEAGDRWVEALNNNYHSQCFKCSKCHKNLEGQSFFAKGGKPFCKAHAQRGF